MCGLPARGKLCLQRLRDANVREARERRWDAQALAQTAQQVTQTPETLGHQGKAPKSISDQ